MTFSTDELTHAEMIAPQVQGALHEADMLSETFEQSCTVLSELNTPDELSLQSRRLCHTTLQGMVHHHGLDLTLQFENSDGSLKETATRISVSAAKAIVAAGELAWGNLADMYVRSLADTTTIRGYLSKLNNRMDYTQGKEQGTDVLTFKGLWYTLSVDGKNPRDVRDILLNINRMTETCDAVLNKWTKEIETAGNLFLKVVKKYDPAEMNSEHVLRDLVQAAEKLDFGYLQRILKVNKITDPRYEGHVYKSEPLSGDYSLFVYRPDLFVPSKADTVKRAVSLRRRTFKIQRTHPTYRIKLDEVKIQALSVDDVAEIREAIKKLMDVLEQYDRSGRGKAIVKIGEQIQGHLKNEMSFLERNVEFLSGNYTASVYRFSSAYMRWASDPMSGLISQAMALSRAAIKVCNASLSAYE